MDIVFFGTPSYVLPILEALHKEFKAKDGSSPIAAVVTQPPKPVGRDQFKQYTPVDDWAHKRGLPKIYDCTDLTKEPLNADLGVCASYGQIIPQFVIGNFKFGILNIHPSLLPQFRGASPIPAAIVTDTNPTGVTILKMDEKLDHGPIITQFKEEILPDDTTETLRTRLFERSAQVLADLIPAYISGKVRPKEQDHEKASYARSIKKEDAFIPPEFLKAALIGVTPVKKWEIKFIKPYTLNPKPYTLYPNPSTLVNFIRAMTPWPIGWTYVKLTNNSKLITKKRLKILKAHLEKSSLSPVRYTLVPDEVQLEGKTPVSWKQFCEAYPHNSLCELQ